MVTLREIFDLFYSKEKLTCWTSSAIDLLVLLDHSMIWLKS